MGEPPPEDDPGEDRGLTRRTVLQATGVGVVGAGALAGCIGDGGDSGERRIGYGGMPLSVRFLAARTDGTSAGPVAHWRLDGTGDTATDTAGGNDAAIRGTPTQGVAGVHSSSAYDFAGGDGNYLVAADASALRPSRLSVGGWYRTNSGDLQQAMVQKADALFGDLGFGLEVQTGSSLRAHVAVDSGVARVNPWGLDTFDGDWHHVCLTWDGDALVLYLDGEEVARDGSQSGDVVHSDRPLYLGRGDNSYTTYYPMEGRIDDVRVYDRPLTPSEVTALVTGEADEEETTTKEPTPTPTPTEEPTTTTTTTEEPTTTTTTEEPTPTTTEEPTTTTTTTEEPTTTTTTTTEEPTTQTATPIPNDEFGDAGYGAYGYGGIIS